MTERLGVEAADPMYVARHLYTATALSMMQDVANAAMRRISDQIDADVVNALRGQAARGDQ